MDDALLDLQYPRIAWVMAWMSWGVVPQHPPRMRTPKSRNWQTILVRTCDCSGWVMLLAGTDNIRDVVAFPKTTRAQDMMAEAPNRMDGTQLSELFVKNTVEV